MKLRVASLLPLLIITASAVSAAEDCGVISDSQQRLACYDLKYKPAISDSKKSSWQIEESVSKLDDSKSVAMLVSSDEQIRKRFGGSDTADLFIRCHEGSTSLYFVFADHFLASVEGYGQVTYRLDNEKPKTVNLSESTDNKALGLWNGGSSIPFIKKMLGHNSMIVRLTPYNESPITATFQIAGIDDAVKGLRSTCKW